MSYKSVLALAALAVAAASDNPYFNTDYRFPSENAYKPVKITGFTDCKGRKHLSKKKRKQQSKKFKK